MVSFSTGSSQLRARAARLTTLLYRQGLMLLRSGCVRLLTVAPSQSSIAGRRDAPERYTEIATEFVRLTNKSLS